MEEINLLKKYEDDINIISLYPNEKSSQERVKEIIHSEENIKNPNQDFMRILFDCFTGDIRKELEDFYRSAMIESNNFDVLEIFLDDAFECLGKGFIYSRETPFGLVVRLQGYIRGTHPADVVSPKNCSDFLENFEERPER